jgi:hypothetical protein
MRNKHYVSTFEDYVVRHNRIDGIVKFWTDKGDETERTGDLTQAHKYWQQAEHWNRTLDNRR